MKRWDHREWSPATHGRFSKPFRGAVETLMGVVYYGWNEDSASSGCIAFSRLPNDLLFIIFHHLSREMWTTATSKVKAGNKEENTEETAKVDKKCSSQ